MQFSRFRLSLAWSLLWLGVLLSGLSLIGRARLERSPSPVEIALEWGDATRLSSADKVSLAVWLRSMRSRGARGVTLDVKSVRDLAEDGRLTLWGRAAAIPFFPSVARLPSNYRFVVGVRDKALYELALLRRSGARFGGCLR